MAAFETGLVQRTSDSVVAGTTQGKLSSVRGDGPSVVPREVVAFPLNGDAAAHRVLVLARKRDRAPFDRIELDAATFAVDAAAIAFIRFDARPRIAVGDGKTA